MTRKRHERHVVQQQKGYCPIIVAESIADYRSCISTHVNMEDVCIEIGCANGVTTARIATACKTTIGVDKSESQLQKAKERFPDVRFELIGADDIPALLSLQREIGEKFTVLFVDISGNAKLHNLLPILEMYDNALEPRLIIVKAINLWHLANRMSLAETEEAAEEGLRVVLNTQSLQQE